MDFSDQSLLPEFQDYDNLLLLRTCSKAFGMAGLRLGFAVGQKRLVDAIEGGEVPLQRQRPVPKAGGRSAAATPRP